MAKKQDIAKIDSNFTMKVFENLEMEYYDATESPFSITGLWWYDRDKQFCRLPIRDHEKVNEGVTVGAWYTAGVQIRFRSNARQIGVVAQLRELSEMPHMPLSGNSGFDFYLGTGNSKKFVAAARPVYHGEYIKQLVIDDECEEMREWTVYLPLYNGVKQLSLAVNKGAVIEPPTPFTVQQPILFYGSSITQGGCASRPGNSYAAHLCRWVDANMINLGFSGSARAEDKMIELLCEIEPSVFVLDYDYNAPDAEHLEQTHEKLFKAFRQTHPRIPIIIVTKPDFDNGYECSIKRRDIIKKTYDNAVQAGDNKVWFVDGELLFEKDDRDACTVDGCHPNDLGFYRMAKNIYPAVKDSLNSIQE